MRALLAQRHFGPFFVTQFLGAFNDNFYKTAMLLVIVYQLQAGDVQQAAVLSQLAAALFILPFFLFSLWAGALADRHDKTRMIRLIKAAEIAILAVGSIGLMQGHVFLLFTALFAMGVHSAFFGPVKYAIIPQHVAPAQLTQATGLVEAGTFLAILSGQLAAGLMARDQIIFVLVGAAIVGLLAALAMPATPILRAATPAPEISAWRLGWAFLRERSTRQPILQISYFWALGLVMTTQLTPLVVDILSAPQGLVSLYLALFSIGIAAGALLAMRLRRHYAAEHLVQGGAWMIAVLLLLIWALLAPLGPISATLDLSVIALRWLLGLALAALAMAAGVYIVPLYVAVQSLPAPHQRARLLAVNNVTNSAVMVVASLGAAAAQAGGLATIDIVLMTSFIWIFLYYISK